MFFPRIRIEGSETSGRLELFITYWRKPVQVYQQRIYGEGCELRTGYRYRRKVFDISFMRKFARTKKCVVQKAAFLTGNADVDYCEIQATLLARRHGRKLRRFDANEKGNSSTIVKW